MMTADASHDDRARPSGTSSSPFNVTVPHVADIEAGTLATARKDPSAGSSFPNDGASFKRSASSTGLRIAFKDLTFSVPSTTTKGETAYLLKNVSGFFEPSQITALMGPSGSGKTTLLDLLAGRKTTGKTDGAVSFGGSKPTPQFLRRYTGYVEQFDTLLGDLTVSEMLMYTAELKRPLAEPISSKRAAVERVLEKLSLDQCANVKIGDPMSKGISGGQAKRVNIGIALITNPRVLFLDEPTSGLDSYTANEVMKVVRSLTRDGTTICATIHSPTASTFALFDRVMMLVRGSVVYFGAQGTEALQFAISAWPGAASTLPAALLAGLGPDPPQGSGGLGVSAFNDAEWLVEVVTEADHRKEGAALAEAYARSQLKKDNDARLDSYLSVKPDLSEAVVKELATRTDTETPWYWGLAMLLKYRTTRNYANPAWLGPRIADKLLVSLIMLTLYLGIGDNFAADNLINIQSALFMWALLPAFGAASYVPAIVLERRLFLRERADGLYRVVTYLCAKLVEEILLALVITLILSAAVFYAIDLQGSWAVFWLVYFADLCVGIVLAYLVAAVSPNMDVANAALPAFVVTLLFFAGQLITLDSIPEYWYWYSRIDFLRYAWSALMVNQFAGENNVELAGGVPILSYYSLDRDDKWANIGYLAIFFPVFAILGWAALSFIRHQKR